MKLSVMLVLLLFSCSSAQRVAPREVSRAADDAKERSELVASLEAEVNESNRLRGELGAIQKADDLPQPILVADANGYTPRLIVFTALEWCPPCRKFDVEIKRLGEMTFAGADGKQHKWSELIGPGEDKAIQIVDLSDEEDDVSAKLAVNYTIEALPTVIRLDANGKQESRFNGWMNAETLCRYQAGKWKPPPVAVNGRNVVSLCE